MRFQPEAESVWELSSVVQLKFVCHNEKRLSFKLVKKSRLVRMMPSLSSSLSGPCLDIVRFASRRMTAPFETASWFIYCRRNCICTPTQMLWKGHHNSICLSASCCAIGTATGENGCIRLTKRGESSHETNYRWHVFRSAVKATG